MAEVETSRKFDASADEMWGRIGDYQGIHEWHPGIESCTPQEDGQVRSLGLPDGGTVVERLVDETDHSYTYRILDSPLPVADYEATISVRDDGDGSAVDWRASFTPKGASEDEAVGIIRGIFDSGLEAL